MMILLVYFTILRGLFVCLLKINYKVRWID